MTFFVDNGEKIRLDVYLTAETEYTRSYIKKLSDDGHILLNGEKVKCGTILKTGDVITLDLPPVITNIEPQDIPLDIIYEDADIAVINKQQGLTVHPAPGNYDNTLVNGLMFKLRDLSTINGELRPGIVHRLDKDTSGVMVVAKNNAAHLSLSRQIADRTVTKYYYGLVDGHLKEQNGRIDTLIGRNPKDRKLMAVTQDGRQAITGYEVIETFDAYDLVRFTLYTGRTHQIRVHARYINHPIVGDKTYGRPDKFGLKGQLLHSYSLTVRHPKTDEEMTFNAPLPGYFEKVLDKLRGRG